MRHNFKIIIFFFLVSISVQAQKHELGKVTIAELEEKRHPKDSSAVAAFLFQVGKTRFEYSEDKGFQIVTEISTKIKIYKKEGYRYADEAYSYYNSGGVSEAVDFSKVNTYNLVAGKIEKTKLKSDGEFVVKENKNWSTKKITLPDVKEGSIVEYKVEIRSPYITNFPRWDFQKEVPVNYSEYSTYIPEYYFYNVSTKGFIVPKKEETTNEKVIRITSKERNGGFISTTTFTTDEIKYKETATTYTAIDIPALKDESFVNNIRNYTASILHELSGKRMPNSPYENFATDWESVTKSIYEQESFGNELKKTGYFEKDIDPLINGVSSREEKIGLIFGFVKNRMNWNDNNGLLCDEGVKKAYQDKTGNSAEINLMLTSMLRYAGIEANPVLISTRSNGISLFPSRTAFNHVIAGVEVENNVILLDATSKYSMPNILPIKDLNWFGRIIRKEGSSAAIDLIPNTNSKEVINLMATISKEGQVNGKVKDQYFDYNAYLFRDQNIKLSSDSYLEKLEKKYNGIEIEGYNLDNKTDLDKPVIESYSFIHNNMIEVIGDKLYFSPMLFFAETENPFKQEVREYPVDFVYPHQDRYLINLTIPEGYAVESLPQSVSVPMSNNHGGLKYMITNNERQIQLSVTLDINTAIISADYYEELKAFFAEVIKKETEKVVLKKV